MKVKDLVEQLQKAPQEDEVEVMIRRGDVVDEDYDSFEYQLHEPAIEVENGWDGLTTIELGRLMGN